MGAFTPIKITRKPLAKLVRHPEFMRRIFQLGHNAYDARESIFIVNCSPPFSHFRLSEVELGEMMSCRKSDADELYETEYVPEVKEEIEISTEMLYVHNHPLLDSTWNFFSGVDLEGFKDGKACGLVTSIVGSRSFLLLLTQPRSLPSPKHYAPPIINELYERASEGFYANVGRLLRSSKERRITASIWMEAAVSALEEAGAHAAAVQYVLPRAPRNEDAFVSLNKLQAQPEKPGSGPILLGNFGRFQLGKRKYNQRRAFAIRMSEEDVRNAPTLVPEPKTEDADSPPLSPPAGTACPLWTILERKLPLSPPEAKELARQFVERDLTEAVISQDKEQTVWVAFNDYLRLGNMKMYSLQDLAPLSNRKREELMEMMESKKITPDFVIEIEGQPAKYIFFEIPAAEIMGNGIRDMGNGVIKKANEQ